MRAALVAIVLTACSPTDDSWRGDLHRLAAELPARHVAAFAHVAETTWRGDVAALDAALPGLDDAHAIAGLMRLAAELGDGHTRIAVPPHGNYPLVLTWFDDGIFVIGADQPWAIGRKLAGVGTQPIDQAIAALTPLAAHDNTAGLHGELPDLLIDPIALAGVDLAPSSRRATFVLAASDGTTRELALEPSARRPSVAMPTPLPLHLRGPGTAYWNAYDDAEHLLYVAYDACADDPRAGPFARFAATTLEFADTHPVDRFVIDLRRNDGGNASVIAPLIDGLAARPALAGRVFVIIGMHTLSSAVRNAMELAERVHAHLVGGPAAGSPNGYGEVESFVLPHGALTVHYSTKHFTSTRFSGDTLAPELAVVVRSADWFAGRDPALDAIAAFHF